MVQPLLVCPHLDSKDSLQKLRVCPHRSHALVQGDDLGAVLDQQLVPGVHHGGLGCEDEDEDEEVTVYLVEEDLLHVLQLKAPLVDIFLQLAERHAEEIGEMWREGSQEELCKNESKRSRENREILGRMGGFIKGL